MSRSVNHVASRARRKRILKLTKGYFGACDVNAITIMRNAVNNYICQTGCRPSRNKYIGFDDFSGIRVNDCCRIICQICFNPFPRFTVNYMMVNRFCLPCWM